MDALYSSLIDLLKHTNIKQTTDGGSLAYIHRKKVRTLPIDEGINLNKAHEYETLEGEKQYEE